MRRRGAPLLLIAGALAGALLVAPKVPREHRVELRLPDASTVTGVDVAWASAAAPRAEAVQGGSWHFASGSAPAVLDARVHLPDGRYALDVTVERGSAREGFHKVITLGESDHILVPLR